MCLALIAINQHPKYPLIILANRDEFNKRSSVAAHYWQENSNIFAGKDLVAGGTWLGINRQGRFSMVTNYRDPSARKKDMKSRGLLVRNYLSDNATASPTAYIKRLTTTANQYNLFNLFVGNMQEMLYYSNVENQAKQLTTGLYGISNHLIDTPWYKVVRAKELFKKNLNKLINLTDPDQICRLLFPILEDQSRAPDKKLPQTGVSKDLEKALSPIFVNIPEHVYGTRNASLLLFEKDQVVFSEKIFLNGETQSFHTAIIKMR